MSTIQNQIREAIKTRNHRTLLNLAHKVETQGLGHVQTSVLDAVYVDKMCELINSYGTASILKKRNVAVECSRYKKHSDQFAVMFKDNNRNSAIIAGMICRVTVTVMPPMFIVELLSGETTNNYSKTGKLRPANNGPGYGTIIRAFVCAAAKKLGAIGVKQTSAYVREANKQAAREGRLAQPVSAYIMNKLGFTKNVLNKSNPLSAQERILWFKKSNLNTFTPPNTWPNVPTTALNSVMSNIFKNRS